MPRNLEDYQPVDERLRLWRERCPEGRIVTDMLLSEHLGPNTFVFKATVFDQGAVIATGWASETVGEGGPVNRTNALENAETSAIGRALANTGFPELSPRGARPSREEMQKVTRAQTQAPAPQPEPVPEDEIARRRVNKAKAEVASWLRQQPFVKKDKWTPTQQKDVAAAAWTKALANSGTDPQDETVLPDDALALLVENAIGIIQKQVADK